MPQLRPLSFSNPAGAATSLFRFTHRHAQARQEELVVLGVPIVAGVGYYERRDGTQSGDNLSCVVEPTL